MAILMQTYLLNVDGERLCLLYLNDFAMWKLFLILLLKVEMAIFHVCGFFLDKDHLWISQKF